MKHFNRKEHQRWNRIKLAVFKGMFDNGFDVSLDVPCVAIVVFNDEIAFSMEEWCILHLNSLAAALMDHGYTQAALAIEEAL